ncbi:MAG: glutamate-1-semialdehyde 2,1-aminomutase [Chitinophagaceae bacterium]|nr:glutamate-1-semialdehyde 2,1-aminomutase [Chitinophagaceae bacterium]
MLRSISNFENSSRFRSVIHDLIPGGAHTYSKGDDQFPQLSPAAIAYGKGSHVWDVDGNEFLDCSMGLTSVSLGHAYEPVLEAVREALEKGVNFQRPSLYEKEMAELFLSLVPQHDMIKFAKNGSIVTTAAVKLARAATGRKLVAFPGDHPFYSYDDWFIGTTPCDRGVPEEITGLSVTFQSCNIESLRALFRAYPGQIACVITEPEKSHCCHGCNCGTGPQEFLKQAIALAHEEGALFILDEMVTGFKTDLPGSITKYGLDADMATWGKGIANGFSFCALTGKKEIMELGGIRRKGEEKVFLISTTHGAETHAIAAAMATIHSFREHHVIDHLNKTGARLIELSRQVIAKHKLESFIDILACDWQPVFLFRDGSGQISMPLRTLMLQEMIRNGVLFQGFFVPSLSHSPDDTAYFAEAFDASLRVYKQALEKGTEGLLVGEPTKPVFRKYL